MRRYFVGARAERSDLPNCNAAAAIEKKKLGAVGRSLSRIDDSCAVVADCAAIRHRQRLDVAGDQGGRARTNARLFHQIALRARRDSVITYVRDAGAVSADLRVARSNYSRSVSQLNEVTGQRVIDEDFQIAVGILSSKVAVRRESYKTAVVADRGWEVSVRDAGRQVARRSVGHLS